MYTNTVVNGPKKRGKKKAGKKSAKKRGKKKAGKKKASKRSAKTSAPKAKKPRKKKRTKKARKKAAKKPAARGMMAPPIGGARPVAMMPPPIGAGAKKARKKKATSKVKVDAGQMAQLAKGLSEADASALEQARRAGTGEKALTTLARRLRSASRGSKKAGKKKVRSTGRVAKARATGRRGLVPGDLPIRAGAVPERRAAARKAKCRPGSRPPVKCRDRPSAASAAACSTANAMHNARRRYEGEPTRSTKSVCGPGVPNKKESARLLAHRKAAKIGPKSAKPRKVTKYNDAEARKIMNRFLRS